MKRIVGMILIFLAGCATGGVSSQWVPQAQAQAPAQRSAQLTRWEYACRSPQYNNESATALSNRFGDEGWELVTVRAGQRFEDDVYCFKRPKP